MLLHEAQDSLHRMTPDLALASGFIPAVKRNEIAALFGYFAHLLSVVEQTREPMLGEIRLQWWRDVWTGLRPESEIRSHPLASFLTDLINQHHLPMSGLADMVDAVSQFFYDDPPDDFMALEYDLGRTYSVLLRYASLLLAEGKECGPADLAGQAGIAYAISAHLCTVPFHQLRGLRMIPASLGVDVTQSPTGSASQDLRPVLMALLDRAQHRFDEFQTLFKLCPSSVRPAFAVMGLVAPRLRTLRRIVDSGSPLTVQEMDDIGPFTKIIRLWQTAVWGRV